MKSVTHLHLVTSSGAAFLIALFAFRVWTRTSSYLPANLGTTQTYPTVIIISIHIVKAVIIDIGKVCELCWFRFVKVYVLSLTNVRELGSVVYRIT